MEKLSMGAEVLLEHGYVAKKVNVDKGINIKVMNDEHGK
jgi:hypothetical protein